MDENLTWLTQKTEELKCNKGNFSFPWHTVNAIELQSNKKVASCFTCIFHRSVFYYYSYYSGYKLTNKNHILELRKITEFFAL